MQNNNNYTKFTEIAERLPDFCQRYLYEGQAGKSLLTRLNYARDIEYFLMLTVSIFPHYPDKKVKEITIEDIKKITPADINLYLSYMEGRGLSPKTIARRKTSVSTLFVYLTATERLLDFNPVSGAVKVRIPSKDYVIYLNREEQEQLLSVIMYGTGLTERQLVFHEKEKERDLAIVFLFLDTGMRISELQGTNIKDLNLKDSCITVTRKGGKSQKIYFSDESASYISDYLDTRKAKGYEKNDPLFLSNRGTRISARQIETMLDNYVRVALPEKQESISPHKLRSSFAMEFYKQNKDILLLQRKMGHKSIIATNIYAKAVETEQDSNSRNWRNTEKQKQ